MMTVIYAQNLFGIRMRLPVLRSRPLLIVAETFSRRSGSPAHRHERLGVRPCRWGRGRRASRAGRPNIIGITN